MTRVRGTAALLAVLAAFAAGCNDSDAPRPDRLDAVAAPKNSRPIKANIPARTESDRFATGLPTKNQPQRELPPAPGTLEALAAESVAPVIALHNVAAALGRPLDLPDGALAHQASDVRGRLLTLRQRAAATDASPGSRLAGVLNGYAQLAVRISRGDGPLTEASRVRLAALETSWRRVLRDIGRATRSDLVSRIPPLPTPNIPAPAPPEEAAK